MVQPPPESVVEVPPPPAVEVEVAPPAPPVPAGGGA
jgi:hypothetical protein